MHNTSLSPTQRKIFRVSQPSYNTMVSDPRAIKAARNVKRTKLEKQNRLLSLHHMYDTND